MNYFVVVKPIKEYREVKFYSVEVRPRGQEEEPIHTEFEKFMLRFRKHEEEEVLDEFNDIMASISHIGNDSSLLRYLRDEQLAYAFPVGRNSNFGVKMVKAHSKLRLYCIVYNDFVILCNGGLKTAQAAQNCPNVKPSFDFANKLFGYCGEIFDKENIREGEDNGFYIR